MPHRRDNQGGPVGQCIFSPLACKYRTLGPSHPHPYSRGTSDTTHSRVRQGIRGSLEQPNLTEWTNGVDTVCRSIVLVVDRGKGRRGHAGLDPLDHSGEYVVLGVVVQGWHIIGRLLYGAECVRAIAPLRTVSYHYSHPVHNEYVHN